MKKIKSIGLLLGAGLLLSTGCEKFEDMNKNPNEPTEVPGEVLLPSVIRQGVNTSVDAAFLVGNNAAQLTAKTLRTEVDAYDWNAFPKYWDGWYGALSDVKSLKDISRANNNDRMYGTALVLEAWLISSLTNAYGDIPYSEAIEGLNNNFTPVYDEQQAIYNSLLDSLDQANTLLRDGEGEIDGDILLGNDATLWQRFGNSLALRLIMTSGNKLADAGSRFADIYNNKPLMEGNAHNAVLDYTGAAPNQFPLTVLKIGDIDAVAPSEASVSFMEQFNDPRLMRYARPKTDDFTSPVADSTFGGAVNGPGSACPKGDASAMGVQYFTYPNLTSASELGLDMADGIIMTYAELEFTIAEAIAKGWISGTIGDHYRAGIEASHNYYEVDYAPFGYSDFTDFYTNSGVAYSQVTDIWAQKWLALFFTGMEPYYEVRRWYNESGDNFSGIPFLGPTCNNENSDNLPTRFLYPGEEQSLNSENYQQALSRIGGTNSFNADMWILQ